ncbi:MAG: choice-of-anchor Q domain-containing protein [Mariniphaga sp.]
MKQKSTFLTFLFFLSFFMVSGTNYYCDPVNGNLSNDGLSVDTPWPSLQQVVSSKSFAGGDTLFLLSGNHGAPSISKKNTSDVIITRYQDEKPLLNKIAFYGASHWVITHVDISSQGTRLPFDPPLEHPVYPVFGNSLVLIRNQSSFITLDHCNIYSIEDASEWTKDDWNYKSWNGVYSVENSDVTLRHCHIKNTNFSIHNANSVTNNLYEYNVVENFNGDALRADGKNTVIQYNIVKNSYKTNGNHDDMVQAFKNQNPVILRGNLFISHSDPDQPFQGSCQGIGFFDGFYHGFIIENNVVATNHWHGITLLGAKDCKVVNNTVVDLNTTDSMVPWIMIDKHKDGTPSSGCLIRNNITPKITKDADVVSDHNWIITHTQYSRYFVNVGEQDYRPTQDSPAVDKGSAEDTPAVDLVGTPRPQGKAHDIGAYEFLESSSFHRMNAAPDYNPTFYPNPITSTLHFEFPYACSGRIRIADISGNIVLEKDISALSGSLDLSEKKSGIYFLQIDSNQPSVHKIIKL